MFNFLTFGTHKFQTALHAWITDQNQKLIGGLNDIYNFVVEFFFIWIYLWSEILISKSN